MSALLSQLTQIEFTIEAIEKFKPEDRDTLWKLLKKNVAEARVMIEELESKAPKE